VRWRVAAVLWLMLTCGAAFASAPVNLPVYIEDSHAGTFYWIIQNLPLDRDFQLVLIDAHSDASEVFNSDAIRARVLRAATDNQLNPLVRRWRSQGAIQCFNWIEPLLPHPISKVWWIPADSLTAQQIAQKQHEVATQINAHEEAWSRTEGDFTGKYQVIDWQHFTPQTMADPVVVSVDLDYFASDPSFQQSRARLDGVLKSILKIPNLQALTFSISRPYLASDAQAQLLLHEALRYMAHVVNAEIHYEPFMGTGEDRSEKAKEFYRKRMDVPRYQVENAPPCLRTLLLQNSSRIKVEGGREKWDRLLRSWQSDKNVPHVSLWVNNHRLAETDEHEVPADQPFRLRLDDGESVKGRQIHWKVLVADGEKYNLANEDQGFADGAPKYLVYREVAVTASDGQSEVDDKTLFPFLDKKTALGTLRVYCEVSEGSETYTSNTVRFSRYEGDGYIGKLTEIFNLPYVYGSALLRVEGQYSADARYGADCSNFIIYGRRREGFKLKYMNPQQLIPSLVQIDKYSALVKGIAYGQHGPIQVTPELVRNGLLLHFGKHMAAVYRADPRGGVLGENTLVVHQLETYPEITTFGAMAAKYKEIRIMTFK
jgi:hypothetical protein